MHPPRFSEFRWEPLADAFLATHRSRLNVGIHLVTTPLGVFAALALLAAIAPPLAPALVLAYATTLLGRISRGLWATTGLVLAGLTAAALTWAPGWPLAAALVAAAYAVQELAHILSGEPSLQSTYEGRRGWLKDLTAHTFYLLPLVLHAAVRGEQPVTTWLVPRNRVHFTRLDDARTRADLRTIRAWVEAERPTTEHTTHWWWYDLAPAAREAFFRTARAPEILDMLRAAYGPQVLVEPVDGMNEVYVAGPDAQLSSDSVFYRSHVDGPWMLYPGAALFRCMVGVTPNRRITTVFPNSGTRPEEARYMLDEGEALAFDFNRELHYIRCDPSVPVTGQRVSLKLHFVVMPAGMPRYGRWLAGLTTAYNIAARRLFLATITPRTTRERLGAALTLTTTWLSEAVQRNVGVANLGWVALVAVVSACLGEPAVFVAGTSFVHYLIYMAVFHHRGDLAFPVFVRNATFFKALALAELAALYLLHFEFDAVSLALIAAGGGLSYAAYRALGAERTYFGAELGRCEPRRVDAFPYGLVPHPMIVGGVLLLAGFHALAPLRAAWPWLVPVHIGLYLAHLGQEVAAARRAAAPR